MFTSLGWHDGMIIASDEQGCFYCLQINSDKGIEEIKKYTCRIHQIIAVPNRNDLFVVTDQGVDSIKIIKGIKVVAGEYGHTAPIIGMYSLEPYKLT